jgi:hypothetical protein
MESLKRKKRKRYRKEGEKRKKADSSIKYEEP